VVRAIQTLSPGEYKQHLPYVPKYFQRLYLKSYANWSLKSTVR